MLIWIIVIIGKKCLFFDFNCLLRYNGGLKKDLLIIFGTRIIIFFLKIRLFVLKMVTRINTFLVIIIKILFQYKLGGQDEFL